MPLPINPHFKRKVPRRVVSRSFRIPPEMDRMLDEEARKKGWTKSFLIKDIIHSWCTYEKARRRTEGLAQAAGEIDEN